MQVVHGSPQTIWMPVESGKTVYVGDLVTVDFDELEEGVMTRRQADGASDTTNHDRPLGVCIGTNRKNPLYNSTYKAEYVTAGADAGPHSDTTEWVGVEGPYGKGDKLAMVKVALICPGTVLRAPIYNDAVGTAPTLLTWASAASTTGVAITTNAVEFTPVTLLATIYCRSGENAGIYRTTSNTSTTAQTWNVAMPYDTAVGDTFVMAGCRAFGPSYVRFGDDTCCSYMNNSETQATDYDTIWVHRLDLSVAGEEYVEFEFDSDHYSLIRA